MDQLPYEVLFEILLNVGGVGTILNLCQTNRTINAICNDEYFWKRRLEKVYPNIELKNHDGNYKEFYKWIYSTGIGRLLIAPPRLNEIPIHFILPHPLYSVRLNYMIDALEINARTYVEIIPDISIYKNNNGYIVFEIPRNVNNTNLNLLQGKIINTEGELNNYIQSLVDNGYYQVGKFMSQAHYSYLDNRNFLGNILIKEYLPNLDE